MCFAHKFRSNHHGPSLPSFSVGLQKRLLLVIAVMDNTDNLKVLPKDIFFLPLFFLGGVSFISFFTDSGETNSGERTFLFISRLPCGRGVELEK